MPVGVGRGTEETNPNLCYSGRTPPTHHLTRTSVPRQIRRGSWSPPRLPVSPAQVSRPPPVATPLHESMAAEVVAFAVGALPAPWTLRKARHRGLCRHHFRCHRQAGALQRGVLVRAPCRGAVSCVGSGRARAGVRDEGQPGEGVGGGARRERVAGTPAFQSVTKTPRATGHSLLGKRETTMCVHPNNGADYLTHFSNYCCKPTENSSTYL